MIKHYLKSLRIRVISLSAILGILMIAGATFSYRSILETSRGASDALSQITSSLEVVEDIQGNILNAYRATDLFLLEPNNPQYRKQVEDNLDMALSRADALAQKPVDELLPGSAQMAALQDGIEEFRRRTTELFLTRSDVARMYPSVGVASSTMEPNASTVMNAFDMILSDRKERENVQVNDRIFTLWYEASTRWGKAISSFRLYLANQFGSFNEAALQMQEESVRIHLDKLDVVLLQLAEVAEQDQLSFEESIALEEIIEGVRQWGEAFDEVLVIHHSGKWREDTRLMKDSIIPIIDIIFRDLQSLEYDLNEFGQQTLQKLNASINRQNLMLAGVIGLFLLYALALMFSLERMALRPISGVARALKNQAFGKVSTQISVTPSKEIQDLVDAFAELQHQIITRQEELEHQAFHDSLTGLPNRKMLEEHIEYQLRAARREKKSRLTLMILDLNEFKQVNDELGHHIGDKLLIDVGFNIKQVLRDVDIVARLGGDEFAILLPKTNGKQAEIVARKILSAMGEPFTIDSHKLLISASIGIAIYPRDGEDYHALMQHADVAMYTAKRGRTGYAYYDPEHDIHSQGRMKLVHDLRYSLEHGGLELHFQPQINIENNKVYGAEALLRWNHPGRGFIPPEQIVELAEQFGLIEDLTFWVMKKAIQCNNEWHRQGYDLTISVNLSVQCLMGEELVPRVNKMIKETKCQKGYLCLEITESGAMSNPGHSQVVLEHLASMGITLSIDDFGTGLSSLAYLKRLPVHELKIDKSFVMDMEDDASDEMIVQSTIDLGHNLGLKVVAEGVENLTVLDMLRRAGCDKVQGYHYSRPLDNDSFMKWLSAHYPGIQPALVNEGR